MKSEEVMLEMFNTFFLEVNKKTLAKNLGISVPRLRQWSNGEKKISYDDFASLKSNKFINLKNAMFITTKFSIDITKKGQDFLIHVISSKINEKIVSKFISSQRIRRILKGESKLYMADVFNIIDQVYSRLPRFISCFVDLTKSDYFFKLFKKDLEYCQWISEDPFSILLCLSLELRSYKDLKKNFNTYLASILNTSENEIERRLKILSYMGVIRANNDKYGVIYQSHDTGLIKSASRNIYLYYRNLANQYHDKYSKKSKYPSPNKIKSAYLLYKTSPQMERKIHALTDRYYNEIKSLVHSPQNSGIESDEVQFLEVSFFSPLNKK